MSSAFDEAINPNSNNKGVVNILHGKNLTSASTCLSKLDKSFAEFKRNVLKNAGKINDKNNLSDQQFKMSEMFRETERIIQDEFNQSSKPNDRTYQRLATDYENLFKKYQAFCMQTLGNTAFCVGVGVGDNDSELKVTDESSSAFTIKAGNKAMVFKTYDVSDMDEKIIDERDIEAQKIAKRTAELNALFVDVGNLVKEQQVQIDEIADNVETSEEATREGLGQLNQAVEKQKSNGKMFCYCMVLLVIVIFIIHFFIFNYQNLTIFIILFIRWLEL